MGRSSGRNDTKEATVTRRAAGYSRYSTDLQNERSIEDQEALIRRFAALNGLTLGTLYSDAAQSGASIIGRDGLLRMLADAQAGKFEVLVVEELDRLSRDMEDLAGIHKRLTFAGVEIIAVHEGVASTVTVGLRGLVGQLYREDNARKVRRGLAGKVAQGLSAGGRAYGYRADPANPGRLIIQDDEATVIRRIFAEFVGGASPTQIAAGLNADGIPAPRSSKWAASTIYGWEQRRSGILRNDLYSGRIVWNKARLIKDPETGRRVQRTNDTSEHRISTALDLQIVPEDLWKHAQERIAPRPVTHQERARMRRQVRPLSGLLRCGACGSGMSAKGKDKSGRVRIECTCHSTSRSCPDPHTFYLDRIEAMVLHLLEQELAQPRALEIYVNAYNEARREYYAGEAKRRADLERKVARLDAEVGRLLSFIARGMGDVDRIAAEYDQRCRDLAEARAALALAPPPLDLVALHPQAVAGYRRAIADLAPIMASDESASRLRIADLLRRVINTVTVRRGTGPGQISIEIDGTLAHLIKVPSTSASMVGGTVVARGGFEPPTPRL
ncbi:recombinase family protein [Gemmobacter denitrificans]|uniref:recombinase family protein n=1 Tax=Gemmobacter denitrificans TaxID=3123040 RepID=UPI0033130617